MAAKLCGRKYGESAKQKPRHTIVMFPTVARGGVDVSTIELPTGGNNNVTACGPWKTADRTL